MPARSLGFGRRHRAKAGRFYLGSANLVAIAETRRASVAALQAADRGDIASLMAFARS